MGAIRARMLLACSDLPSPEPWEKGDALRLVPSSPAGSKGENLGHIFGPRNVGPRGLGTGMSNTTQHNTTQHSATQYNITPRS